jgi:putative Mg2+ transporter-C (MgtC) family protein
MLAIQYFDWQALANTLTSVLCAFCLGGLIGYERQVRQRTAGLRTNILVSVGAALFVSVAYRLSDIHGGVPGGLHVVAYVVSGIGFLGAGVIMREQGNIRGINTAATLWGSAAVGVAAGASLIFEALIGTVFVLAANTLMRPFVDAINRAPLDSTQVEVTNSVYVIAPKHERSKVVSLLEDMLERARYPIGEIQVRAYGENDIEVQATLLATSVKSRHLDALMTFLKRSPAISHAFWAPSVKP